METGLVKRFHEGTRSVRQDDFYRVEWLIPTHLKPGVFDAVFADRDNSLVRFIYFKEPESYDEQLLSQVHALYSQRARQMKRNPPLLEIAILSDGVTLAGPAPSIIGLNQFLVINPASQFPESKPKYIRR